MNDAIHEYSRYFPAEATLGHYDPAEKEHKQMMHLVAYDISSPKRLRLVAKVCEDYGVRVEYSVFECDLSDTQFQSFWSEINSYIDDDEDSLLAYTICAGCVKKTRTAGTVVRPRKVLLYIL